MSFYSLHRRDDNFDNNKIILSNNKMRIKVKKYFIYIFFINSNRVY